jgi:hypothetical protein
MNRFLAIGVMFVIAVACSSSARAQATPWRGGVWGSGAAAIPSSSFGALPGTVICLEEGSVLESDGGGVFAFGGEVGWREPGAMLELSARIGVGVATSTFAHEERIGRARDALGNTTDIVVEYGSQIDRIELRVEPNARFHVARPIVLSTGAVVALPLRVTYDQRERLIAPAQATYRDGATERTLASGSLEDRSAWLGLTASVGVDIEVAGAVLLRPELGGVLALGSPVAGLEWRPHELRLGVALLFGAIGQSTPINAYPRE